MIIRIMKRNLLIFKTRTIKEKVVFGSFHKERIIYFEVPFLETHAKYFGYYSVVVSF